MVAQMDNILYDEKRRVQVLEAIGAEKDHDIDNGDV